MTDRDKIINIFSLIKKRDILSSFIVWSENGNKEDMGFNKDVLFMVGENVQSVTREMKRMRQKGSRWLDELPEKYN